MSAIDDTMACIGQLDAAAMVAARERQGTLIAWIHTTLGAVAVIPFNPKRTKNLSRLAPTWTADALGKRSAIERFFGRLFRVFPLQRPTWPGGRPSRAPWRSPSPQRSSWPWPPTTRGAPISSARPSVSSLISGKVSYELGNALIRLVRLLPPRPSRPKPAPSRRSARRRA